MVAKPDLRTTWRLVKPHALPRLPWLGVVVALGWLSAVVEVAPFLLIEPLWTLVIFPAAGGGGAPAGSAELGEKARAVSALFVTLREWGLAHGVAGDGRIVVLIAVSIVLVATGVLAAAAQFGFVVLSRRVAIDMVVDLRQDLARHLVGLSLRYHGQRSFGDLLSRISADVETTLQSVDTSLKRLIQEPATILALIAAAFYTSWQLSLLALITAPALAVPLARLSRRIRRGSSKSLTTLGASVQKLAQMFQGIRTVKAFRAEEHELARYRELNENYRQKTMSMVRTVATARAWTMLVAQLGFALLLLGAGFAAIEFEVFRGEEGMVTFFLCLAMAFSHLKSFVQAVTKVDESIGASERLQAILDEPIDVRDPENGVRIEGLGSGVRFERVSFTYPGGEGPAISQLDLDVRPGETLALVGPSGSGKSTLVDLVCRFIDPTEGRITVDGVDLREASLDSWTKLYAMVGQHPFLFHTTIAENIRYGKQGAPQAEVERAARAAHIHDFVTGLPGGYETNVADAGVRLSGGQRQRITIARAILKEAPLLLLDEATSALDSESEAAVHEALERLRRDRTVIVIAHRLSTIQGADRIAVLDRGRLVELGTHEELVQSGGTYARLYSLQRLDAPVA